MLACTTTQKYIYVAVRIIAAGSEAIKRSWIMRVDRVYYYLVY